MHELSIIDLHCHSSASDGALSPTEVVEFAISRHLKVLALTDHDTIDGIPQAQAAADQAGLQLIPGIEISTSWRNFQIHVVGLFMDPLHDKLQELLARQRQKRDERAVEIGAKLERLGFADALARTKEQAAPGAAITRGNYARFIVSTGACQTSDEAFNKYLKRGRPAYVNTQWGSVAAAVETVAAAGGVAVLAHPRRYVMTNTKLRELIADFKAAGGEALEVASAQQRPADRDYLAQLCGRFDLFASAGSDFHQAGVWRDLGFNLQLPANCTPLWQSARWGERFSVHDQRRSAAAQSQS